MRSRDGEIDAKDVLLLESACNMRGIWGCGARCTAGYKREKKERGERRQIFARKERSSKQGLLGPFTARGGLKRAEAKYYGVKEVVMEGKRECDTNLAPRRAPGEDLGLGVALALYQNWKRAR